MRFKPNFIRDYSSVVDFTPIPDRFNTSETDEEADLNSLKSDWQAVGLDLNEVIAEHESNCK